MSSKLEEIKHEIKSWEYKFKAENDRLPLKQDVNSIPEIKKLYALYKSYKTGKPVKMEKREKSHKPEKTYKSDTYSSPLVSKNRSETTDVVPPTPKGELGPTPQANGRVLSIFDFGLTPPESSPLKQKSEKSAHNGTIKTDQLSQSTGLDLLVTPTKANKFSPFASTQRKNSNLASEATPLGAARKLNFAAVMDVQTPNYMKQKTQTPTFSRTVPLPDFLVSPSPLKSQRMMRKLTEVYKTSLESIDADPELASEFNTAEMEINDGMIEKEEKGGEAISVENRGMRKQKTQKRLTRRVKMAPRLENEGQTLDTVNIQDRIQLMEEQERTSLMAYMNSESEDDDDDDDGDDDDDSDNEKEGEGKRNRGNNGNGVQQSPIKRTRKPVTANYKRLKINDPRSRKFKQRMRRR